MYIVMYWLFKKNKIPCWIMLTSWVPLPVVISLSSSVLPSQSLSTRSPLKPKVLLHFWNKHTRESLHYLPLNFYIAKIFVWKLSLCTKFESLQRFRGKLFDFWYIMVIICHQTSEKDWPILTQTLLRNAFGGIVTDSSLLSRSNTRKGLLGWEICTTGPNNLPIWKVVPT